MWMIGFCTTPNRARAIDNTIVSMRVGSCHDTTVPGRTPMACRPAATARAARSRNSANVTRRSASSSSMGSSGDAAARRSTSSHIDPTS